MSLPIPTRQPSARSLTSPTPSDRGGAGSSRLTPAQTAEQRKARREQLRNFYGIKDGDNGASSSGSGTGQRGGGERQGSVAGVGSGDPLDLGGWMRMLKVLKLDG
jgi:hypothetical protein